LTTGKIGKLESQYIHCDKELDYMQSFKMDKIPYPLEQGYIDDEIGKEKLLTIN
jgi:hypothetical protein